MGHGVDTPEPLLEREAELDALKQLIGSALEGHGRVLSVEGPAGIGKTRVLDLARQLGHDSGCTVASARGGSLEQDLPFGAVRQLLEPLVAGDHGADLLQGAAAPAAAVVGHRPADTDLAPGTVLPALYWLVVALSERRPLLLVCDDAHWFDPASLRLLAYLAHRVGELPVAVVIGSRPPAAGADGELLERLLDYPGVTRLRVEPLSRDAVGELVRLSFAGDASRRFCDAVADASNGNPFLVGEMVRAASSSGGPAVEGVERLADLDVEDAVLARIGRLSPAAAEVAKAVAVLGSDAHLRHVAALAGLDIDAAGLVADDLLRADVLGPGRPLAFVHPLVATAVSKRLLPGERSARHRRAAALLLAEAAPPERVAPHLMSIEPSGDRSVVDTLSAAAESAMRQGATEVAIGQLRRALAEPPPPAQRVPLLLRLGLAESLINDPEAIGHLDEVIASIPDVSTRLSLTTALATSYTMHAQWTAGRAALGRFDRHAADDATLRLRQLAGLAIASSVGRVPAADLRAALFALREALPPGAPAPGLVLAVRAFAGAIGGEPVADAEAFALRALDKIDDDDPMLPIWFHLVAAALPMLDRDDLSAAAIERGLTAARRAGAPTQVSVMLFQRATIAFRAGELDDAYADAEASLELCADHGLTTILPAPLSVLLDVLRENDRLDEAEVLLDRHGYGGDQFGPPGFGIDALSVFDLLLLFARARTRGAQGRWDEAHADLDLGWELAQAAGCAGPGFIAWQANRAFARVLSGVAVDAQGLAEDALADARRVGAARPIAESMRVLVMAGGGTGEMLRDARESFARLGARLEEIRTVAAGAYGLDATGSSFDLETLARAVALADEFGAVRLAALFRARVKALGGSRRQFRPSTGLAALTASERRVAALAAAGRTNKEVAQELFVTVKTVETHLARTFQKLSISSRAALREALSV